MLFGNAGLIIAGVVVLLIVLLIFWVIGAYNKLVKARNKVKNSWSQIDVQLQRRFDLIPNLVETVKGYTKHENEIFSEFAKARSLYDRAKAGSDVKGMAEADKGLSGALGKLLVVTEQYPELKANVNFSRLMDELTNTESKVAYSRQFYNDVAQKYNIEVEKFPGNIIANLFNFDAAEYFEVESEEVNKAPKVEF